MLASLKWQCARWLGAVRTLARATRLQARARA